VPENSKRKSTRENRPNQKEKNQKTWNFSAGRGGGARESERGEKRERERTLEIGDGGGVGWEGDDEARAEGRLQEYRRGVGGGHGVFSGSLTHEPCLVWSAAEEGRKESRSKPD
jgi:hypothetical protein